MDGGLLGVGRDLAAVMKWYEAIPNKPVPPSDRTMRAHLIADHGFTDRVCDAAKTKDVWHGWHSAEHRTRHPSGRELPHTGHLHHTHPPYLPGKQKASTNGAA